MTPSIETFSLMTIFLSRFSFVGFVSSDTGGGDDGTAGRPVTYQTKLMYSPWR
jgi:hypothetical protein